MGIFRKPPPSARPRLAPPYDSPEPDDTAIVLLTDVVGPPALRANTFESLIRSGDPSDALEGLTRSRLPELDDHQPGMLQRAVEFLVTGRRRSSVEQVQALVRDWTAVTDDVADYVAARNRVDNARMKSATTPLRYDLEREYLRAETARQRGKQAQYEQPQANRPPPPAPTPTAGSSEIYRKDDILAKRSRKEVDHAHREVQRARAQLQQSTKTEAGLHDQIELLDIHRAKGRKTIELLRKELDERGFEIDRLAAEVQALTQDLGEIRSAPAVQARRHAEELAEADHKVALAKKAAEATEHRSKAKEHRQRTLQPAEEFTRRARERMREATTQRRALDQLRREVDERLRLTAERHGVDSEQYKTERDMYDDLLLDLEETTK